MVRHTHDGVRDRCAVYEKAPWGDLLIGVYRAGAGRRAVRARRWLKNGEIRSGEVCEQVWPRPTMHVCDYGFDRP